MKIPEFSVKQPVATLMLFLAVIIIGAISISKLTIDLLPAVEPPAVSILTFWPGASASDVETEVTELIENQVNSANNMDTLTSKSLDNLSVVTCMFDWGTNLDVATNEIREKLELTKRDMPADADPPMIYKFSSATMPVMTITVTGGKSWPRLHQIVDKQISDELKKVPGVGAIVAYGGGRRRINIYFDIKKIEGFRLSLPQINQVLAAENMNIPAGSIKSGLSEYFIRVPARYKTALEIRETVVAYWEGKPVYLRDIADVRDDYKPEELNGWVDGKKSILLMLQKQSGKNTVAVVWRVKKKLAEIQKNLPSDVKVLVTFDTGEYISMALKNLRDTLFWGLLFVVLITVIFLRRLRGAVIISLAVPFSLVISFIFLYIFGYTINVISLMALVIVAGMVVDDGIVVFENIVRHVEHGGRIKTSAISGASEMGMAVTASTLSVVVVFLPLMFVTGITGIIFKELAFVVSITMLASLFTSLSMTPMLSSRWLSADRSSYLTRLNGFSKLLTERNSFSKRLFERSEHWFEIVENGYRFLLDWSLRHAGHVIFLAIFVFISSLSLIPFLSTSFMPEEDAGDLRIDFRLQEGTRIEETNRVVEEIMKIFDETIRPEEYRHSYGFDGASETGMGVLLGFDEGPNVGQVGFKLVDRDKRKRSAKEIADILREKIQKIPGFTKLQVTATSNMKLMMRGAGRPVSVEVQGTDMAVNYAFSRKLEKAMKKIPGLRDVVISQKEPRPELWVEVDRAKASSLGLNIALIAGTLRNCFYGVEATKLRDAGDNYDIFTRLRGEDKDRLKTLPEVPIFTTDGRLVRLGNVARIVDSEGPVEIQRKNRQKIIKVEADTFDRPLGDVAADIRAELARVGMPQGVTVNFGADIEEQGKAFRDLTLLSILSIVLVYMTLASLYGNLRDPLIIMFSVPFAISGVFYAFFLWNIPLDIMTFMGIVLLEGIVAKNAIILLDYIHLLQKRGMPLFEAIIAAGKNRLRPILMTTLTTIFAMFPMALSHGVGAEIWNAMGITLIAGLSLSTFITLILIPAVYYALERRKMTGCRDNEVKI
ncbi:MAG: efflux RND transporter permease subunit [Syntrophales bacterium]|nr:efflux RND transporter permease subunit [Syntrophales bacterium]